ncbi:MAG: TonB-dependent receptor plug domain-containing protein [Chitinophagaceae bacterium]
MSKKIFTLIALSAAINALAQKDTSKSTNLDEVVITATKFPIKTSATGKVINVITQQQLEQSGGKDLAQILTEQTGLYINGANSNPGKDKSIYLRGAAVAYTLITIDGVPVYDASGIGGNFDIRNLSVNLVERIEILKGSQSTLYGSDALAGVINIITKKSGNNTKPFNGNALLSYGSNNTIKASAGINGKEKNIDYYAGYSIDKTDGINEAISTSPNADKDGYKQESFQAGFGIQANKNISIKPYMRYTYLKGDIDQGGFIDELDYTYSQKSFQTGVKSEFGFGKTKLNVLYNFNKIERGYTDDSTKSQNGYDMYSNGIYNGNEHFVDAYANFVLSKSTKLTVGADFRASTTNQDYLSIGFFGPYKTSYGSDSLKQHQTSAYAALNYNNNEGFNVEVGGRYNNHSTYGSNGVFNINPSYQATNDIKIFANISSAYRTPSLYQLYSEYGNKKLKPEVALSTEIGLQHFFVDKKIKTQFVIFSRDVKDVIFFYYNSTTFQSIYINQDKQQDLGLEFDASFQLCKNTTLKTAYTFVDGQISSKKGNGKDTTYNNLLRRPKHSINAGLSSQITKKLFLSANLNWFGKRKDAYFNNTTFTTNDVVLNDYTLLDVYAEYGLLKNKIKLFANARNITDAKYTEISGYNTLGTTITGGVRFTF